VSSPPGSLEPFEHLSRPERRICTEYHPDEGGPLELVTLAGHPAVRAMSLSAARWRRRATVACAGTGLLISTGCLVGALVESRGGVPVWSGLAAGIFIAAWPLVMLTGAALRRAARVVDERRSGTVLQLVLTPLEKRPIAAAMILPHAAPFLWGIAAALPVYLSVGGSLNTWGLLPPLWVFWPFRIAAVPLVSLKLSATGLLGGTVMFVTDIALVWAALHWGAAYAVRLAALPAVGVYLAGRLAITTFWLALFCAGVTIIGGFAGMIFRFLLHDAALAVVVMTFGFLALWLWWGYLLPRAVRLTLSEFAHFDRLADENFEVKPLRLFSWFRDYGERP
jgi:hypothetical protein